MTMHTTTRVQTSAGMHELEKRLRLHQRLQYAMAWFKYLSWLFPFLGIAAGGLLLLERGHAFSLLPFSGMALLIVVGYAVLLVLILWQNNVTRIAESGHIAAVGPLLDYADATFLDTRDSSRKPKPKSEGIVLRYLLARMPAGDGPDLTPRQRSTLNRLSLDSRYQSYFSPDLRDKIGAIVEHDR